MSYFYRLEDNFSFYHNGALKKIDYLPVKKEDFLNANEEIFIYLKNNRGSGIFAIATTVFDKTIKYCDVPIEERNNLLNSEYLQIKINIHSWAVIPLIEEKYLKQFPSYDKLNEKPESPFTLYNAGVFDEEYKFIQFKMYHSFNDNIQFLSDNFWKLALHLVREHEPDFSLRNELPEERKKCAECGLNSEQYLFLEKHDRHKIDFKNDYKPVSIKDFEVLCPNCHKKRHIKIRAGKVRKKIEKDYIGQAENIEKVFENSDFYIFKTKFLKNCFDMYPSGYLEVLDKKKLRPNDMKTEDLILYYYQKTKELDIEGIDFDGDGPYPFENSQGKYGYIDIDLNIIVEAKYLFADRFYEGFALVSNEEKSDDCYSYKPIHPFFIDKKGNEYHFGESGKPKQYATANNISEGLFCVNDLASVGIPDIDAHIAIDMCQDEFIGNWGYADSTGKEVIKPQFICEEDFKNGHAHVIKGKWINNEGNYESIIEGCGVIDKTGKEIIPFIYDCTFPLKIKSPDSSLDDYGIKEIEYPEYFAASYKGKFGILNYKNEWIVDPQFEGIYYHMPEEGLVLFCDECIDEDTCNNISLGVYSIAEQSILIKPKYSRINSLKNGHLLVEEIVNDSDDGPNDEVQRVIDKTGKEVFPSVYTKIDPIDIGYIVEKWKKGEPVLKGIIDKNGKEILSCNHPVQEIFIDKQLLVFEKEREENYKSYNKYVGLMKFNGEIIFPPILESIDIINNLFLLAAIYNFKEYSSYLKKGLFTLDGEIILPMDYDKIDFHEDLIIAQNTEGTTFYKIKKKC